MKRSAYANHQGMSYQTAWRMWRRGEVPDHQLPAGTVMVEGPLPTPAVRPQQVAIYARTSSASQRTELERQAERVAAFCAAKGWHVARVVKECGAAVTEQRPQFLALLADTSSSHIVVEQQDRCARFGVASMQTLLKTQGRDLVIVNEVEADQEDFRQDFVALNTSCCVQLYGRRRASRKTTHVVAVRGSGTGGELMLLTRAVTPIRLGAATPAKMAASGFQHSDEHVHVK